MCTVPRAEDMMELVFLADSTVYGIVSDSSVSSRMTLYGKKNTLPVPNLCTKLYLYFLQYINTCWKSDEDSFLVIGKELTSH